MVNITNSLRLEDVLNVVEKRRNKKKKWIRFKIDGEDVEKLEGIFGEGNITKGVKYAIKQFLSDIELPEDDDERNVLEALRNLIEDGETETYIDWESAYNVANKISKDGYEVLNRLNKNNYIRIIGDYVKIKRRGKYPDPIMEWLGGSR